MGVQQDRILPFTRILAVIVVPFLVLAFLILYFFPQTSGQNFAWSIQPNMTAMFMGAGYIGGAWLFVNAIFGKRWHRIAPGFPAITAFTVVMLLATILHWDRFDINHFPFVLWLGLYVVTPFLVPFAFLRNQSTASAAYEADDVSVPRIARMGLLALGIMLLAIAVIGFVMPNVLISIWQWQLTPLTARVMSGWLALLGVGGVVISRDARWSAWRVGLQCIGSWHVLVVIAALLSADQFPNGLANWYLISVVLVLIGMLVLYVVMERQRMRVRTQPA